MLRCVPCTATLVTALGMEHETLRHHKQGLVYKFNIQRILRRCQSLPLMWKWMCL